MKLKELHINNFKFFPKQDPKSPLLKIDEKNLLIYGENGSGKSTIYWALYTLLESSFKNDDIKVSKYFTRSNDHSLINIYAPTNDNAHIKAVLIGPAGTKDYLVSGDLPTIQAIRANSAVRESSMASDFINYRALFKLHHAKHTNDNDLFSWFEDEILPYIRNKKTQTFGDLISVLRKGPKQVQNLAGDTVFANTTMLTAATDAEKKDYRYYKSWDNKIKGWTRELSGFLKKINTRANEILEQDFKQEFTIKLQLVEPRYNVLNTPIDPDNEAANLRWLDPQIKITVPKYQKKNNAVKRPHSFLNEAKWTAIGLSIRLAILEDTTYRPSPVDLKCLVMDDMLLSLDMSTRDIVLDLLLTRYVNDYQLILMTHDRSFYEFAKRKIDVIGNRGDWNFIEMYESNTSKAPEPYFKPLTTNAQAALDYFNQHDYPACGIYLRKEVEKLLINLLPEEYKKEPSKADPNVLTLKRLNDLILSLQPYCLEEGIDATGLKDLKTYKDALLNPLAHNDEQAPYYKVELKQLIDVVAKLSRIKRTKRIYGPSKNMNFILNKPDASFFSVFMKSKETVVLVEEPGKPSRISIFTKCKVSSTSNNGMVVQLEENFDTLKEVYSEMCRRFGIPTLPDVSRAFDYDGKTFDQLLALLPTP